VIASKLTTDTRVLDDLSAFMGDYTRMVSDAAERAFNRILGPLLDELRFYPVPRPNQKYDRSYKLRDGWNVAFRRASTGFEVIVSNATSYAKFVVGSLAQARAAAASFQAWMHRGRWPLAFETVIFWFEAFKEELQNEIRRETLDRFGSTASRQRAFTR
jgi:hypothetical protein